MARSYIKKSEYWGKPRRPLAETQGGPLTMPERNIIQAAGIDTPPAFDDAPHYTARAGCGDGAGGGSSAIRNQSAPSILDTYQFPNIRAGLMPFDTVEGNYSVNGAIGVCYQAYFNFSILRNAINLLADFSVGRIHVKTQNQRLKDFINTWFDAIGLNKLQAQHYLEYYRSGNVFYYKFSGKISDDGFNMLKQSYSAAGDTVAAPQGEAHAAKRSAIIPIRYIILNPMQVYLQRGASYTYGYVRMLSTYEIERLKNPQTEEDKQIFKSFPEDIQRQIKQGGAWRWLFVPLDQNRLYYVFYRKQDYEPLAVPLAFPVLNDIEFKLNLRRIDTALANSVEQMFMLVTTGRPADQYNQVSGAKNMQMLQEMFQSRTIGRVLVADYTTKAEWKIPDIKDLLGPGKYERVDKDIKEGLQYMFFGEEKFANASIKVKIFIESLKEGRRSFIESFLLPEVKKICEAMNFKNIPELEYEEVQIQDEALMNRLYVQLAQMGLLDADETFTAMKTGMLPTKEESLDHQKEYRSARLKGLYQPIAPIDQYNPMGAPNGRPAGSTGTPAPRKVATPIGQSKAATDLRFGALKVADQLVKMNELRAKVQTAMMAKWGVTELNEAQQSVSTLLARNLVVNEDETRWMESVASYVDTPREISAEAASELNDIMAEYETDNWTATVLSRSKVELPEDSAQ